MVDTLAVADSRISRQFFVCRKYDDFTAAARGLRVRYTGEKFFSFSLSCLLKMADRSVPINNIYILFTDVFSEPVRAVIFFYTRVAMRKRGFCFRPVSVRL